MAEVFDFGLQEHKIKMDGGFSNNGLFAVVGDTARRLEVQLLNSNNAIQDTTGINLRLNAEVAGKLTFVDAVVKDATKGIYTVNLSNGMFLEPGNWAFQWQITKGANKISSFPFDVKIGENISEGGEQATNFYLNVEELRLKTIELETDFDKLGDQFKILIDETTGKDVISAPEIIAARSGEIDLNARLTKNEQDTTAQFQQTKTETTAQLAQKASITYVNTKTQANNLAWKESFETLAGLQTAYPTGDSFNHVVLASGSIYTWLNGEWTNTNVQANGTGIADKSITPEKTTFFTTYGKNLFNKETITTGGYINYLNGEFVALENYAYSKPIPVIETQHIKSNTEQYVVLDENQNHIGGGTGGYAVNISSGGRYVILNMKLDQIHTLILQRGNTLTGYEEFKRGVAAEYQQPKQLADLKNVSGKNGDYKTVKEAIIDLIAFGELEQHTIVVNPGRYKDYITQLKGAKTSIIGVNKRDCVLYYSDGDYFHAPIDMSAGSYLKNLSIIANNDDVTELPDLKAYGIHHDSVGEGLTLIENCVIESYQNSAVGIGTRQGQTIVFKNCDIYTDSDYGATLYFHNAVADNTTNQKLIFDNCRILAKRGDALRIEDSNILYGTGNGTDLEVEFINCHFWSEEKGLNCYGVAPTPIGTGTLAGNIRLSSKSYGNNLPILNGQLKQNVW